MTSTIKRFYAAFLLFLISMSQCWCSARSERVLDAISLIQTGRYNEAAASAAKALDADESDPVASAVLGVVLLHTGRLADARVQMQKSLAVWPENWQAHYALAVIAVLEDRPVEAEKQLAEIEGVPSAARVVAVFRSYLKFVNGGSFNVNDPRGMLPVEAEISAVQLARAGKDTEAESLFASLVKTMGPAGFAETHAPLPTMEPNQPISVPGSKFTWKPAAPSKVPVVNGTATLRADADKLTDVSFVSLFVDDACISVTNNSPYQFDWDTTTYSNGLHRIKIEAKGKAGSTLSSKSFSVRVANERSGVAFNYSQEDMDLMSRLWAFIQLSPSRKLAHYELGRICEASGRLDEAQTHFEYAVAADPKYRDSRSRLNNLRGWGTKYAEAWRGRPGGKMVALTFDDGPNERTADMLEVLARLKVPATFFVVGFRAETQPELVRAMIAGGHELESHTYTHTILTTLTADEIEVELSRNEAILRSFTGKDARYFRPPGGHANATVREAAGRQGFTGVFWTVLCSPYEGAKYPDMARYVIKNTTDGSIILMHNGEIAATSFMPQIVKELRAKGYRFVTLSELLSRGILGARTSSSASK